MRMAGPDVVLFIVGALLFGGAAAAIVSTGGDITGGGSATGAYQVTFTTDSHDSEPQAVASFASATGSFAVNNTDVTRFVLVITCNDAVPAPAPRFQLTVEITPPAASNLTVEPVTVACAGETEVPVEVAPVPGTTTVRGSTEAQARENLARDDNATRAVGDWGYRISGARSPAPALPVNNAAPSGEVVARVETWHPAFAAVPK